MSLAPEGLIVLQVFFHSPGSAVRSSSLNGRFLASQLDVDAAAGSSPLGSLLPGSLWTSPLAVMIRLAVPPAHAPEDPVVGVQLQPAGEVADRCTAAWPR